MTVITLRIHSIDGTDYGTLTATPEGGVRARPNGERGRDALEGLLRGFKDGQSAPAFLHHLARRLPGRAVPERDDWRPDPHGHAALTLAWDGTPEATLSLEGGRLRVDPAGGKDERSVRNTLESLRRPHWSDEDLFAALPELLTGRLRADPAAAPGPGRYAADSLGQLGAQARVSARGSPLGVHSPMPEPPPLPLSGPLIRSSSGPVSMPPRPQGMDGNVTDSRMPPGYLHNHALAAGVRAALQGYDQEATAHAWGYGGKFRGGLGEHPLGHLPVFEHAAIHAFPDGGVHVRPVFGQRDISHNELYGQQFPLETDEGVRVEGEPTTRVLIHDDPVFRGLLGAMRDSPDDSRRDPAPYQMLADWLGERGHPAAGAVASARNLRDVVAALSDWRGDSPEPERHAAGLPERYAAPTQPHPPETMGSLVHAGTRGRGTVPSLTTPYSPPSPLQATRRAVAALLAHHERPDPSHLLAARDAVEEAGMAGHDADPFRHNLALLEGPPLAGVHSDTHRMSWPAAARILLRHGHKLAGMPDIEEGNRQANMLFGSLRRRMSVYNPDYSPAEVHDLASLLERHGFADEGSNPVRDVADSISAGYPGPWHGDLSDAFHHVMHTDEPWGHWPESARRFLQATDHVGYGRGGHPERYAGWAEPPQPWEARARTGEPSYMVHPPPPPLPERKPAATPLVAPAVPATAALPATAGTAPPAIGTGPAARPPSNRFFTEATMLEQHHPEQGPPLPDEIPRPVFMPKHVWDHLTPVERGFFAHPANAEKAQRALAYYAKMASLPHQNIAAMAGEQAKDWYNEAEPVLEMFGAHGPLFSRVTSANSTRNTPLRNLVEGTALYRAWLESGMQGHDPSHHAPHQFSGSQGPTTLPRFMLDLAKEPGLAGTLMMSRAVPTARIFSDPANLYAALEGPKTASFGIDLDPFDPRRWTAVTHDIWDAVMLHTDLIDAKTLQDIWGGKNVALYPLASAATRRVAAERGWEPRQAQAAQWVATRAMAGLAKAGLTPEQIVKYLTHEHIRNTSDSFLKHFVEDRRVRESLRRIDAARGSSILAGVDALAASRREAASRADRPTGPVFADASPHARRLALDLARRASRYAESYPGSVAPFADAVAAAKRDSGAKFRREDYPRRYAGMTDEQTERFVERVAEYMGRKAHTDGDGPPASPGG